MRHYVSYGIALGAIFFVTGCGVGGMWMNGNPFPAPAKPYLEYWEKPDMTPDSRIQVSTNCGGGLTGRPQPSESQIKASQKEDESNGKTYARLFHEWERCMIRNGYKYTGECYDNDISKAKPACGAP